MRKLVVRESCALGEGGRKAGEVLAYIPEGVHLREILNALNNPSLYHLASAPELGGEDEDEGGGEEPATAPRAATPKKKARGKGSGGRTKRTSKKKGSKRTAGDGGAPAANDTGEGAES